MMVFVFAAIGYLLGSVPNAFLVTRRFGGIDIRLVGSGNVGATNVNRAAGPWAAILTAVLDVAKGSVPVLLARAWGGSPMVCAAAGVAAVVGHIFPVWLQFHGGKGVATMLGVSLAWAPAVGLLALTALVITVWASRIVSLGSVLAALAIGPVAYARQTPAPIVWSCFFVGWLIVIRHRGNIMRFVAGTERRLGDGD
jgi:acyl phosphate:glycerol-3-phosphate acyltransferase